jgi:RimK-like ATP-grasp domain
VILLCGIPSESSLAMVAQALGRRGTEYTLVDQRRVRELSIEFSVGDDGLRGSLTARGRTIDLETVRSVYLRLMDDRFLPEVEGEPPGSPVRSTSRAFHEMLADWADVAEPLVVNRYSAMGSNFSKPYQLQLIRELGFLVPETLVTNEPEEVISFEESRGPLIYKSISSERSIVRRLEASDLTRLERIRWCPVQFQVFVPGQNVRVHTVGGRVFATVIETDAVDYRYAARQVGRPATFAPLELEAELAQRCVKLAATLGLEIAGIDLKIAPDGRFYCLEVNPSPVFSYYQLQTGQPIADAIAELLNGRSDEEPPRTPHAGEEA